MTNIYNKIEDMKAKVSYFSTKEKWVDSFGNIIYVDRAPIDWARIAKEEQHNEKETVCK